MISGISSMNSYTYSINQDQFQQKKSQMFDKLDGNDDGSIDKSEFDSFGSKISEKLGSSIDTDRMFSKIDTDSDGLISKEEHSAMRPPRRMRPPMSMGGGKKAGEADSTSSLLDMLNMESEDDETSVNDILDTNGDGKVDMQDFISSNETKLGSYLNSMLSTFSQSNQGLLSINLTA